MESWNGTFELIDPRLIVFDHRYQREEKDDLIAQIAANPDWRKFGVVVCFKRGSTFYGADGQQRTRGVLACEAPPQKVPVVWFPAPDVAEEADVFVAIQEYRKAFRPIEKHRAKVTAKHPSALRVERAVDKAGFSITGHRSGPRSIASISALYYIDSRIGEDGITQTLVTVRDAWGDDEEAISAQILRLVGDLIAELDEDYNRPAFTAKLQKTTPGELLRRARALHYDIGGTIEKNLRRAAKELAKI